jgi:hypothetical protein
LDELALSPPKRALASNKSIAKYRPERPRSEVFDVVLGISHQDLLDEAGPAHQEHAPRTNAEARKRAIIAGCVEQEVEQSGAELANIAADDRALWPRRQFGTY